MYLTQEQPAPLKRPEGDHLPSGLSSERVTPIKIIPVGGCTNYGIVTTLVVTQFSYKPPYIAIFAPNPYLI